MTLGRVYALRLKSGHALFGVFEFRIGPVGYIGGDYANFVTGGFIEAEAEVVSSFDAPVRFEDMLSWAKRVGLRHESIR